MIKQLFQFLTSPEKGTDRHSPTIISRENHTISRKDISVNALKVMNRLNKANFQSYLVGGSVRDLLLGEVPKDFDVATNATPEQIKTLFRNSRIIGRRFRIVHIRFGREIIEVTTFRGQDSDSNHQVASNTGQLLRDNVYGDMESDALRRDFTANALYYCLKDFSVYEYSSGIEDIAQRQLRMIGDPATRYQEDPVRLLRAVRFAAKLGFGIEKNTASNIPIQAHLLTHVPPARLFEEVLKLFLQGCATATYHQLIEHQLLPQLFPSTCAALNKKPLYTQLIEAVMSNTDKRVRGNKRVTPAFIFAALLWPALSEQMDALIASGKPQLEAFNQASQAIISEQLQRITIPKRFTIPMRQIWDLQWRLPNRQGKKAYNTLAHNKFRAGYDFLLLREQAGEDLDQLGQWWTQFQEADEHQQADMVNAVHTPKKRRRKRSPKQQQPKPNSD